MRAKLANLRARNLLRKIGIDYPDERTVRATVDTIRKAWRAGVREGCDRARFDPGPSYIDTRRR